MNRKLLVASVAVVALLSFSSAQAGTLAAGQVLRVTFNVAPGTGTNPPNLLCLNFDGGGHMQWSSGAVLTATLFEDSTNLGSNTEFIGSPPHTFVSSSFPTGTMVRNPTVVDFARVLDGSFNGTMTLTISAGTLNWDDTMTPTVFMRYVHPGEGGVTWFEDANLQVTNVHVEIIDVVVPPPTQAPPIAAFPPPKEFLANVKAFIATEAGAFAQDTREFLDARIAGLNNWLTQSDVKAVAGSLGTWIGRGATTVGCGLVGYNLLNGNFTSSEDFYASALGCALTSKVDDTNTRIAIRILSATKGCLSGFGVTCLVGANASIYGELAVQLKILANDPLDLDFTSVVELPIIPPTPTAAYLSQEINSAFAASFEANLRSLLLLGAANRSFDRYSAALAAGDALSATLQLEAILFYLDAYRLEAEGAYPKWKAFLQVLADAGVVFHAIPLMVSHGLS
jgi:hypothetical protein